MVAVTLCNNNSPAEKIGKSLTAGESFDCVFKDNTSILKPVITIRSDSVNIPGYNYMYIPSLNRYYFIDDIVSVFNDVWEISGHVDVLQTYKNEILDNTAVIRRQQNRFNLYLNDPDFNTYNYERLHTEYFTSQSGFNKVLNYILVVNGA